MGIDQNEAKRRRSVDVPKYSAKHPIAAIEKRVIDSESFADIAPSAIVVLLLLARNLDKGRNGHVFVSQEDAGKHGIEKKTLYRAFRELTAHGFIFPTKRGGYGRCGKYALTWLPLTKDTTGLFLENFEACAWRNWTPIEKKKRRGKMSTSRGHKTPFIASTEDKNPPTVGDKIPHIEFHTNTQLEKGWIHGCLAELAMRGLAGRQCFQIPDGGELQ